MLSNGSFRRSSYRRCQANLHLAACRRFSWPRCKALMRTAAQCVNPTTTLVSGSEKTRYIYTDTGQQLKVGFRIILAMALVFVLVAVVVVIAIGCVAAEFRNSAFVSTGNVVYLR